MHNIFNNSVAKHKLSNIRISVRKSQSISQSILKWPKQKAAVIIYKDLKMRVTGG